MTTQDQPPARSEGDPDENSRPVLKLIRGNATDEELAALVTVVAALQGAGERDVPKPPTPAWSANHRKTRATHRHGPGGWRSSALPR